MSREMDALVAEKVMGWPHIGMDDPYRLYVHHGGVIVEGSPSKFPSFGIIPSRWCPSEDIAAAWDVVEKMRNRTAGIDVFIRRDDDIGKRAKFCCWMHGVHEDFWKPGMLEECAFYDANSAPKAISGAALKAFGIEIMGV